ncbi:MAG: DUF4369 domain-containing protein [Muribaculaceae bacterium]|nr:DUF4369 domain-containing protein [Muribaculaceae bacterium]MDE7080929.1 DUF4369 domain-containing protein [Muribaculaceae bacterium]
MASAAFLAAALTACSDPSFTVKGTVADADGRTITLEKADHAGQWVAIDSASLNAKGAFSFSHIAPADPEIYRLRMGGTDNYIYFPVDSVETITIQASAPRFATDFSVAGSPQAEAMARFEKELLKAAPALSDPDSARNFKRHVFTTYLQEGKGSVLSYYILTKTVGGEPLFKVPDDASYFAAVATAFREYRPDDPRLPLLTATATSARQKGKAAAGHRKVVQASEISYIDINLPSVDGKERRLSDIAGKGEPTLLVFSDLSDPATPSLNAELRKLQGVRIYNVGLDDDQLTWRNAATNLPWTCVFASDSDTPGLIGSYQLASLPAIFIIDAAGNLNARCNSMADVRRKLR